MQSWRGPSHLGASLDGSAVEGFIAVWWLCYFSDGHDLNPRMGVISTQRRLISSLHFVLLCQSVPVCSCQSSSVVASTMSVNAWICAHAAGRDLESGLSQSIGVRTRKMVNNA